MVTSGLEPLALWRHQMLVEFDDTQIDQWHFHTGVGDGDVALDGTFGHAAADAGLHVVVLGVALHILSKRAHLESVQTLLRSSAGEGCFRDVAEMFWRCLRDVLNIF